MEPVSRPLFESFMVAAGPFEKLPHMAVAVSGGGDSMALCLLADRWVRHRGGRLTALTVDHGLRSESADEAKQVAGWLDARGIAHKVLSWSGPKPTSGLQQAARLARYRLMADWCRDAGVLHLMIGHNREDQAETYLMRLERGSGDLGLAAMALVTELPAVRVLRPLLTCSRASLRQSLIGFGQDWIEDPTNRDRRFARTRIRARLGEKGEPAIGELVAAAKKYGLERCAAEERVASAIARCCTLYPAGYARLDQRALGSEPAMVSARVLERILTCVGGQAYPPRSEKLKRLHRSLREGELGSGRTLAGCRILPWKGGILVCRERRGREETKAALPGRRFLWEGRFLVEITDAGSGALRVPVHLARLSPEEWAEILAQWPKLRQSPVPAQARASLPAVRDGDGVLSVPHLGYERPRNVGNGGQNATSAPPSVRLFFSPPHSAGGVGFHVA